MQKLSGCSKQLPSPAALCAPLWAWQSPSPAKVHCSASCRGLFFSGGKVHREPNGLHGVSESDSSHLHASMASVGTILAEQVLFELRWCKSGCWALCMCKAPSQVIKSPWFPGLEQSHGLQASHRRPQPATAEQLKCVQMQASSGTACPSY